MIKLLPYILFEKYNNILALEMASPWNRHCANCIGTLSLPVSVPRRLAFQPGVFSATRSANSSQHCRVTNQTTISLYSLLYCCSYRVTGAEGSYAKHLTVEFCTVAMLLTFILIIVSIPSPLTPGLKPSFSANPSHRSLPFSSSGLTTWIPRTVYRYF